jgi:DNA-binding NarL/FixJ family response regulator
MTEASQAVRVVVADDQRVVREGLVTVLGILAGIEVVGAAANGEEAVAFGGASPTPGRVDGSAHAPS